MKSAEKNLGLEFASEVYSTIHRIMKFPKAWQILKDDIRRCITNRFPFGIIYYVKNEELIILAVMQLNQIIGKTELNKVYDFSHSVKNPLEPSIQWGVN
jgi:hypothetical protein